MREVRKIYGELRAEEHKITDAAEEFFRHNEAKGLAEGRGIVQKSVFVYCLNQHLN